MLGTSNFPGCIQSGFFKENSVKHDFTIPNKLIFFMLLLLVKMSIFFHFHLSRVLDHQALLCCQDLFLGALSSGTMHRKEQSSIVLSKNTPLDLVYFWEETSTNLHLSLR